MARIVVSKIGGVVWGPDQQGKAPPGGEQGETLSVIRRLVDLGHDVTYYGEARGSLPCKVVCPKDYWSRYPEFQAKYGAYIQNCISTADQDAFHEEAEAQLDEPDLFVHVFGMEYTSCYIGNAMGAGIYAGALFYNAPLLHAVQRFKKPRICINNDPRSYPKLQEMTTVWPDTLPTAILDQTSLKTERTIGGKRLHQWSVYAGAENWWTYGRERPVIDWSKKDQNIVVAHAHIADQCKQPRRHAAWDVIFSNRDGSHWSTEDFERNKLEVYGKGWEAFETDAVGPFKGYVRPDAVPDLLLKSRAQPCVAPKRGFYTGKASVSSWYGCCPLFYGGGEEEYSYDAKFQWRLHDHPSRVRFAGELEDALNDIRLRDWNEELVIKLKPDWRLFDDCVADTLSNNPEDFDQDYAERYGGMWPTSQ